MLKKGKHLSISISLNNKLSAIQPHADFQPRTKLSHIFQTSRSPIYFTAHSMPSITTPTGPVLPMPMSLFK